MRNLLAFDLGASNGRAILGQFDGETITMRELHRFENNYIEMNGVFYWDLPYLYNQLKQGLLAFKNANVGTLDCIGIDTWGVDYGLLDKNGQLLSNPRSYRYAVDEDMAEVWKTVDFKTLFARTGIATMISPPTFFRSFCQSFPKYSRISIFISGSLTALTPLKK